MASETGSIMADPLLGLRGPSEDVAQLEARIAKLEQARDLGALASATMRDESIAKSERIAQIEGIADARMTRIEELEAALREVYEVYAGSDGFVPQFASEAYQQRLIKQMADIASATFTQETSSTNSGSVGSKSASAAETKSITQRMREAGFVWRAPLLSDRDPSESEMCPYCKGTFEETRNNIVGPCRCLAVADSAAETKADGPPTFCPVCRGHHGMNEPHFQPKAKTPAECSGDPNSCPENEGTGCPCSRERNASQAKIK